MKSGGVHGDAIHLAFDQDGVVQFADGFAGAVEIEQHARLGVDGGLRRVQIFRAGFVVGGQRASGEGDDFAGLAGDGKHDAVAEARVQRRAFIPAAAFFLLLPGEQAAGFQRLFIGGGAQAVAQQES